MKITAMPPAKFSSRLHDDYVEVISETDIVDADFMKQLMQEISTVLTPQAGRYQKVLIEVIAPNAGITFFERFHAWNRKFPLIRKMRVAYLITGRPFIPDAGFVELLASNRGVTLKFFNSRERALDWLGVGNAS